MFNIIVILIKSIASVVGRVNVYTFDRASKVFFECAKREKIVAVNEHIARPRFPIGESACLDLSMTMEWVMDKETRFHCKWLIFLTNPRKFEFIYLVLCHTIFC